VSGKEQKIQWKTEKSSKNRLILQGKKSKFSLKFVKSVRKNKKIAICFTKKLEFSGEN
jgi:hypothetical protein